jgi:hypothetical protein
LKTLVGLDDKKYETEEVSKNRNPTEAGILSVGMINKY